MKTETSRPLSPFLAEHFSRSYADEVDIDVWFNDVTRAKYVLSCPPSANADRDYLAQFIAESMLYLEGDVL